MSIQNLIESIGLSAAELRRYLVAEIDEFLEAEDPGDKEEEFGDILFALMSMAWAHSGQHYALKSEAFEHKVKNRLREYATLTRYAPNYTDDRIPELKIGVLHFAFGHFGGQWQHFDALKNGTVAEIHLLTEAPFDQSGNPTNHCIVTFDDTEHIEYEIIESSSYKEGGNTVRCLIPNFMFQHAKQQLKFEEFAEYLSLQVLAAIDGLNFLPNAVVHFHSWECGFLTESEEFRTYIAKFKSLFSPYLTIGRLKSIVDNSNDTGWTMNKDELVIASDYERKICATGIRVVVESTQDGEFYKNWVPADQLDFRSFALESTASFSSEPADEQRLTFIAGGRPVREKGFVELCRQFASVRDWAQDRGLTVGLSILCREARRDKGAAYIEEIERAIEECDLKDVVQIESKISLDQLRRRIAEATAVIVSSLYDPFCLMPTYAVEVKTPAFVSLNAGVSENIKSRQFTFDPQIEGDLLRSVSLWFEERGLFEYESCHPTYHDIYLDKGMPQTWE